MNTMLSSFKKEWALLWRDKMGLIFLFILPICLVVFITLTGSEDATAPRQLKLLLLNQDTGDIGLVWEKALKKADGLAITSVATDQTSEALDQAKQQVAAGDYQALIVVPSTLSKTVKGHASALTRGWKLSDADPILLFFDPALPTSLKQQIELSVRLLNKNVETRVLHQNLLALSQGLSKNRSKASTSPSQPADIPDLLGLQANYVAVANSSLARPNDVQQNVPAWALFAMFFIITPLSGTIVKERMLGVIDRIHVAPVCFSSLMLGKIGAFVSLNLLQLLLMLLIGVYLLPLFGLPRLDISQHPGFLLLTGVCASLAATGFGFFIGSLVRTPEQANVIGPFLIVIAAAVGGILIPMYLLPEMMQQIGEYSPLRWAHAAFLDIFLRGAAWGPLWPNLMRLLLFSVVTLLLSIYLLTRRAH